MFTVEEILAKLVSFDTTSDKPNRACVEWIRGYLKEFGVEGEIFADESGDKACFFATVGEGDKPGVMLAGHTDVVPVDDQKWTSDPFVLVERDGKFVGRGAVDMKGFIACALAFVPEFLAAKTGGCFYLGFTSDEETDFSGVERLTAALKAKGVVPDWIWVGEPTGFSIIDQHKGCSAYRTVLTGVPGHSSQPDKGLSAIELASELIEVMRGAQQKRKQNPFAASKFEAPYTTLNIGTIKGGSAENIIAEKCELLWQIRAHPGETACEVKAEIEALAQARFAPRFTAFSPTAKMESVTLFDYPPFAGHGQNRGVQALQKVVKDVRIEAAGFSTEAGVFQQLGADVIVCGPGFIGQAHQPNEFIEKSQLLSCVDLLRLVLLSSSARESADSITGSFS